MTAPLPTIEQARTAAQTDAAIDAAGTLVEAARSYAACLAALACYVQHEAPTASDACTRAQARLLVAGEPGGNIEADAAPLLRAAGSPLAALLALAGDAAARGGERAAREIERCAGQVAGLGDNRPTH